MDTIRLPRLAIFLFFFLALLGPQRAKGQALTTSNAFVAADVQSGSGAITIYRATTNPKERLSFSNDSYLTVQVGGVFFTNNPNGPTIVEPSGEQVTSTILNNGITSLVKAAMPGTDTIRTVWQSKGPNAFDIVQDVYPVAGVSSGQIVYKWSIVNRQPAGLFAQAQFLLDLFTSSNSPSYGNDAPPVTTRAGYNDGKWQDLSNIPPYFITSEYPVCDSQNFPGNIGAGFTTDNFAPVPMGLIKPSEMAVVDWTAIVQSFLWSFPDSLSGRIMGSSDNAMLFQWPSTGVFGAIAGKPTVQEIGRGSYGTPPCTPITKGNLDALLLHPDHIKWNGSMYVPNHFPVEAILWGANKGAGGAIASESITNSISAQDSGPVQVLPTPIADGGYMQPQVVQSGGSSMPDSLVPACGMAFATWEDTVLANVLTNCSTDSSYDITLSVSAANAQQPIFPSGLPVCPIIVDCQEKPDTGLGFPRLTVLSRTGSFDGSICNARIIHGQATDLRMCAQCGVKSVIATQLQNMAFAIEDSASWKYVVSVIDSMQNGSATVLALDGTGETDTAEYSYCTIPDTHAPRIYTGAVFDSGFGWPSYIVTDSQAWDRGLDTIYVTNIHNLQIDTLFVCKGCKIENLLAKGTGPNGSLCIAAVDLAGNKFDTCFGSTASVTAFPNLPFSLSISPNPASGVATISLSQAGSTAPRVGKIEIFDVLGREVTNFDIEGYYEWQMGSLPAGAYIVRAEAGGAVVSKRMLKR
ncbi:MAG TPA: T9SS type A sorting domain-containing protein [Candidatus Kapabacteria bacterium]|nr:T9SS type A sorting domain-containing protein [Candidatus Kapabacteria bacterium]